MKTLELGDLLVGDILLHQPTKPKMHQKKISKASGSPYTHASIYIGNDLVLEANPPKVRIRNLKESLTSEGIIGVLRTQIVFSSDRVEKLQEFAETLIQNGAGYDLSGAFSYTKTRSEYIGNQLAILSESLSTEIESNQFNNRSYFCSALVVACYCVVGIIDESAFPAYPPDIHAPGDLLNDITFGWVLGYIDIGGAGLPDNDPLRFGTLWQEQAGTWW
ncbi:MAG: hypothetical protein ABJV68_06805 [Paracoccaceae bacterium]